MTGRLRRSAALAVGGVVAAVSLSACGVPGFSGLYNIPLPGGANLGSNPYTIKADFSDVLDLVPQSAVRVNDVPVGRVSKIDLSPDGRTAEVTLLVNGSVHLPANATASVQQTSLLGEKYIALAAPTTGAAGTLADHAVIAEGDTSQGVQVEQVFGALSLLLNGGGLGQLQTINTELNKAAAGHEADFRQMFVSLDAVVGKLNAHRTEITTALDQINTLAATLKNNDAKIALVLDSYSPGIAVLAQERTQLVGMLTALNRLGAVSTSTIDQSKDAFVSDLKLLSPILDQLAAAGQALPDSLQILFTYPFSDQALSAVKGDYLNAFITLNLQTAYTPAAGTVPHTALAGGAQATGSSSAPPTLLPSSTGSPTSILSQLATSAAAALSASGSPSASGSGSTSGSPSASGSGSASVSAPPSGSSSGDPSPSAGGSAGGAG